jgi:hypothetical protein
MKKILVFLVATVFLMSFVAADTQSVLEAGADRLIALQNTDGSWDWDVTNATGPTATTHLNIAGVTAMGLLDAYELTGDSKYLTAAEKTGNYLMTEIGLLPDEQLFNAFNIIFLQHLSDIGGNSTYADFAEGKMEDLVTTVSYWKDNSHPICGSDGCTAQELIDADEDVIRSWSTQPSGIVVWDMYHYVEAAQTVGENSFANNMSNVLDNYMSQTGFDDTIEYYELGLSGGILGLEKAGIDTSSYVTLLKAKQNTDGSFSDEPIQGTAYALMALKSVGETEAVSEAVSYLTDNFGYGDPQIDGWLEDDGVEYSEVTSEAVQALYAAVGSSTEVEGTLSDYFWSISVTPPVLSFGIIPRGDSITDPADNGPITIYTTGSDTSDDSVYVSVDVVEESSFYEGLLNLDTTGSGDWELAEGATLVIPEDSSESYQAELQGSTLGITPGEKSATIYYTAYGESLGGD